MGAGPPALIASALLFRYSEYADKRGALVALRICMVKACNERAAAVYVGSVSQPDAGRVTENTQLG